MNITQFIGVPISSWNEFARQLWYEGDTVAKLFKAMCHNCQELFILTSVKNWGPVPEIMGHWGDLQREVLHGELVCCLCMMYVLPSTISEKGECSQKKEPEGR